MALPVILQRKMRYPHVENIGDSALGFHRVKIGRDFHVFDCTG